MKYFINILIVLFLIGCSRNIPTNEQRNDLAKNIANKQNLSRVVISTKDFNFLTYSKIDKQCSFLRVYIEGDGLSWITRSLVSPDPTPITPTVLNFMKEDLSECKIYIARPCQYLSSDTCNKKFWTSHRFSKQVIDNFNEALNTIKQRYKLEKFQLFGYSGGAAIASLLANKRDDVDTLITVAGNLNINLWTDIKNYTKLNKSLNPFDYINNLENIKQYHLIGDKDITVPKEVTLSYINKFKNEKNIFYKIIDANHKCCYKKDLKKILEGI